LGRSATEKKVRCCITKLNVKADWTAVLLCLQEFGIGILVKPDDCEMRAFFAFVASFKKSKGIPSIFNDECTGSFMS
jgi:hypothetical protein